MSITMHSASAPVFIRMLNNMLGWLDKADAHAKARKFDPNNYLSMRLTPDMLPLSAQIQIATDHVKGGLARLAGIEPPKWADDEKTLDALRARIRKAIEYAQSIPAAKLEGSDASHWSSKAAVAAGSSAEAKSSEAAPISSSTTDASGVASGCIQGMSWPRDVPSAAEGATGVGSSTGAAS